MTVLHSLLLRRTGFEHGFGTKRTAPEELPDSIHILYQVHGERFVMLSEDSGAGSREPGKNFRTLGGGRRPKKEQNPGAKIQDPEGFSLIDTPNVVIQGLPANPFRFDEGDALVTDIPGISIGIRTADCLPLLLADPVSGAVSAVHCGWRSLAVGLPATAVRSMTLLTGSRISDLLAAFGPSIGDAVIFEERDRSLFLDLGAAVKKQLLSKGFHAENVEEITGCTLCDRDLFWSYRGGDQEERMISYITARKPIS
jgi:copper oxidase (laccase) domain-containing protein